MNLDFNSMSSTGGSIGWNTPSWTELIAQLKLQLLTASLCRWHLPTDEHSALGAWHSDWSLGDSHKQRVYRGQKEWGVLSRRCQGGETWRRSAALSASPCCAKHWWEDSGSNWTLSAWDSSKPGSLMMDAMKALSSVLYVCRLPVNRLPESSSYKKFYCKITARALSTCSILIMLCSIYFVIDLHLHLPSSRDLCSLMMTVFDINTKEKNMMKESRKRSLAKPDWGDYWL